MSEQNDDTQSLVRTGQKPALSRWLAAGGVFFSTEILPRLASMLLDAWDRRRAAGSASTAPGPAAVLPEQPSGEPLPGRGGPRRRRRRGT